MDDAGIIIDLNLAFARYSVEKMGETRPYARANADLPEKLGDFLVAGPRAIESASETCEFILQRLGRDDCGPGGEKTVYKLNEVVLGAPPLPSLSSRIFCAWQNFPSHVQKALANREGVISSIEEIASGIRARIPYGFYKLPQTVVGNGQLVNVPRWVRFLDYELELAAFVGREGRNVPAKEAHGLIVGFSCFYDWSVRDEIMVVGSEPLDRNPLNFALRKNIPGASMGPYLVIDENIDPYELRIKTRVNGQLRQNGSTTEMVKKFEDFIVHLSRFITLYPGDIIVSGTPAGTAYDSTKFSHTKNKGGVKAFDDSRFLKEGDVVEGTIERIGTLTSTIHFI